MLSALSQPSMSSTGQPPTKKISNIKSEPEHGMPSSEGHDHEQGHYSNHTESAHIGDLDDRMDYTDETPVHPLAQAPQSSADCGSPIPSQAQHSPYMSSIQPQQHQQLLKLKTEHGYSCTSSSVSTPDIIMTNDESDGPSMGPSCRGSSEANMPSNEATEGDDQHHNTYYHEKGRLVVDTTAQTSSNRAPAPNTASTPTPSNQNVDTPSTAGTTAPTSRRPSLRTMPATLPRSALQEETIALFKQYRNLIPCAKCFCRNTIQRDGMSDGNLRFKCRPPVSMSLICNKSYSESKIRNMIANVVYGNSLPDTNTPASATSPGDNVLALAPPPAMKSRRGSKVDNCGSPHIGSEITPERPQQRLQQEDMQEHDQIHDERNLEGIHPGHPVDDRRPSQSHHLQHHMHQQGSSSRRGSVQQHYQQDMRRSSMAGDEGMMMEYDDQGAPLPSSHSNHLQIPSTPLLEGEDPRLYRSRNSYSHQSRAITPTGPVQQPPPPQQVASGRQLHKLHHSHSHPNIGQLRHQQYLEQQEYQREHRGSVNGMGYSNQQQQQQRAPPRQMVRRDSSQYLGGAERRSSHPSPVLNVGSKYAPEAHSPALSSSPRSSPGREPMHLHQAKGPSIHDPAGSTPTLRHASRYEDSNASGYFQRRMSQPHPAHAYNSGGHSGLPPPLPSPLSHLYERRPSEIEEYPQMHREKYERLNANTMLAPSSALGSSKQQQQKDRLHYPSGSPSGGLHPLDGTDGTDEASSRQALTPPTRSSHLPGVAPSSTSASAASSPWINGNGGSEATPQSVTTPQSEPMRYSHSMPMGNQSRLALRHNYSSSSLYYQTPRPDDRDRFEKEHERDISPEYQEVDPDGRPLARMRSQGVKRKSLGQSLSRSSSNQNLYSTNMQHYQHQNQHNSSHLRGNNADHYHQRDLNAAMPRSAIKLTCYPKNSGNNNGMALSPTSKTLDTSDALAMQLDQTSKLVIEIRQPRSLQSYSSAATLNESYKAGEDMKTVHRSSSHPNLLLARPSSSVLGQRRSPSPECEGSSSKKRRGDSDSVPSGGNSSIDNEDQASTTSDSSTVTEAAAAVVAAAAAQAQTQPSNGGSAIQVFGVDYIAKSEETNGKEGGVGLGLSTSALTSSPTIEALQVAKGSSYVMLEDQKEMGIDYSLFTRVETAGWRILIPPNVVASFRSEDFGLMLKPKGLEELDSGEETGEVHSQEPTEKKRDVSVDFRDQNLEQHRAQHDGEKDEEEEDVNVEGVRRIALRDDDRDESRVVSTAENVKTIPEQSIQDDDQEMQEDDEMESSSAVVTSNIVEAKSTFANIVGPAQNTELEQGDVEMVKEQDELLSDE
ncbi:hypothetical protein BGX27_011264 [Mortierella sp. AM989]|nr:hypothetical protein BGX27_011264 [Mortierella sp. AM989]